MINLINIAHVGSTQGKLGALKIFPKEQFEKDLLNSDFVFFRINGSKVPFEVDKINTEHDPWLLYLKEFSRPELASTLSNSELFLEREHLDENIVVADQTMQGFELFSADLKSFGKVIDVEEHPQQILLLVEGPEGEFRIPFHPDLIENLKPEVKELVYVYDSEAIEALM